MPGPRGPRGMIGEKGSMGVAGIVGDEGPTGEKVSLGSFHVLHMCIIYNCKHIVLCGLLLFWCF